MPYSPNNAVEKGTSATNITVTTYHDLEVDDTANNVTYTLLGVTNVSGSLYVTAGTIAIGTTTLNVTENVTNDDTITISTGTFDVDGNLDVGTLTATGAAP